MSETPEKSPYDLVREHWMARQGGQGQAVHSRRVTECTLRTLRTQRSSGRGDVAARRRGSRHRVCPRRRRRSLPGSARRRPPPASGESAGIEIAFRLDPAVLDGRFANNGWLQELPKPITKLTWDNAVLVSPATAATLVSGDPLRVAMSGGERGHVDAQVVELRSAAARCAVPLFTVVGHPDDCVTVHLGYGRARRAASARGAGFNAYAIRPADAMWIGRGVEVVETGERALAGVHAGPPPDGRARHGARGDARGIRQRSARRSTKASRCRRGR